MSSSDMGKLIRVPLRDGRIVVGRLSADFSNSDCYILVTGLTELDEIEFPMDYDREAMFDPGEGINLIGDQHSFKYRNEKGLVVPFDRVALIVDRGKNSTVIHRVGQKIQMQRTEMQIGVKTNRVVPGEILSLGDAQNSFVKIGVPSSITKEVISELPLNILVRMPGDVEGKYKRTQYVITDKETTYYQIDEDELSQEKALVVGTKLSFPELPEIEGVIEHINTLVYHHQIVFIHVLALPNEVESIKERFQNINHHLFIPMEWKGQLVGAVVVLRIGGEVLGGWATTDDGDWEEVNHWKRISMNTGHARVRIEAMLRSPEEWGSTLEILGLFSFDLWAKSLRKLIQTGLISQKQIEEIQAKLKEVIRNIILPNEDTLNDMVQQPIYSYDDYIIKNDDEYVRKQVVEIIRKTLSKFLITGDTVLGVSLNKQIRD